MNFSAIKLWALNRLQEKTTWVGIVTAIVTLLGVSIAPAKQDAIEMIGMAVASATLVGTKENKPDVPPAK